MSLTMSFHSGVRRETQGTWRSSDRTPHLMQGSLDKACGQAALFTALLLLRLVTSDDLANLNAVGDPRLEHIWRWAKIGFFEGTSSTDLVQMLRAVGNSIDIELFKGSTKRIIRQSKFWWAEGSVGLLAIKPDGRMGHWIVVVGSERTLSGDKSEITGVLCIDSACRAPVLAPFNGRLDLRYMDENPERLPYQTLDTAPRLVQCREAIRVSLTGEPLR